MTRLTFIVAILLLSQRPLFSQTDLRKDTSSYYEDRYVAWYSPSRATHVSGLMLNVWPREYGSRHKKYPQIDGIELNIAPISIFLPFLLAIYSIVPQKMNWDDINVDTLHYNSFKNINGVQLGLMNLEPSIIKGLDINIGGSNKSKVNGVTISGIINFHYILNGVTIAPLGNHDYKCNGVQIGLHNSSLSLRGVQIGLWNKNQKRSLPLINWCFKK